MGYYYLGDYYRAYQGDIRSLDYSSFRVCGLGFGDQSPEYRVRLYPLSLDKSAILLGSTTQSATRYDIGRKQEDVGMSRV